MDQTNVKFTGSGLLAILLLIAIIAVGTAAGIGLANRVLG